MLSNVFNMLSLSAGGGKIKTYFRIQDLNILLPCTILEKATTGCLSEQETCRIYKASCREVKGNSEMKVKGHPGLQVYIHGWDLRDWSKVEVPSRDRYLQKIKWIMYPLDLNILQQKMDSYN